VGLAWWPCLVKAEAGDARDTCSRMPVGVSYGLMHQVAVQIVRFVEGGYPGWVECQLIDVTGRCHVIIDKVPVVGPEDLDAHSQYPAIGAVRCEIRRRYQDEKGRDVVCVSTSKPDGIESTEGLTEFTVPESSVTPWRGQARAD